jgi:hypothetical protein
MPQLWSWMCQRHEDPQEQRLKEGPKFNFQTRNKTKLCNSKTITQKLRKKTRDVQDKCENGPLLF